MKRRNLLKLMGAACVAPCVLQKALANDIDDNNKLLIIKLPGGWDTTLSLDPWLSSNRPDESDLFLGYSASSVMRKNNLTLGPSLHPLQRFSKSMSILNGIFLSESDNGHDAAMRYMMTGSTKSQNSMTLNFESSLQKSSGLGVISNNEIYRGSTSASSSTVRGINRAFRSNLTGKSIQVFSDLQRHRTALTDAIKKMVGNSSNMEALFDTLRSQGHPQGLDHLDDALIIASAFSTNSARFAELEIRLESGDLDTHSNHETNHERSLKEGFETVGKILDLFKATAVGDSGYSLFDKTTFMITSEFSRTASLNNAKGKDHNPMTNSALFIGNGISTGKTIGASKLITRDKSPIGRSYQIAKPYDFSSGEVLNERPSHGEFITPESINRTLCEILKIDPTKLSEFDSRGNIIKELLV